MEGFQESLTPPSPTKEPSKSIQAINKDAVHRICSGQVVLNLATAVKELVENSLDAGATSIEIRLREYGSELIEVIDNGCGVEESNLEGLTLKHHTSKLREFSDLVDVETFGFRGEALSSLCALSEMTVTTRHKSCETGTKLVFDSRGHISSKSPCARQIGTTVQLANIFSPLPVRQKEFLRNLKREFMRMTQLLYAYCLISTGVKLLCTNQTKKGSKSVVVSTQGSTTFKGNITCIFGAKQASSLLDLEQEEPKVEQLEEVGLSGVPDIQNVFELEGCISSCAHGQGRSTSDRQFYYINNRPCEPLKVSKVVNEVYRQYNIHQSPFVFLNIKTARCGVDVNVTPDKRQIFLDNEKLLLATIKASLLRLYESIPSSFQFQNVPVASVKSSKETLPSTCSSTESSRPSMPAHTTTSPGVSRTGLSSLLKNFSHSPGGTGTDRTSELSLSQTAISKLVRGTKRTLDTSSYDKDGKKQLCLGLFIRSKIEKVETAVKQENSYGVESNELDITAEGKQCHEVDIQCENLDTTKVQEELSTEPQECVREPGIQNGVCEDHANAGTEETQTLPPVDVHNGEEQVPEKAGMDESDLNEKLLDCNKYVSGQDHTQTSITSDIEEISCCHKAVEKNTTGVLLDTSTRAIETVSSGPLLDSADTSVLSARRVVRLNVTMDTINQKWKNKQQNPKTSDFSLGVCEGGSRVRFYSEINPSANKSAEQELKKEISKDMFTKMVIIGQFNLGFIITRLGPDLFIVDQHATDEKYNFEMLQLHTTIHNQRLVIPQALELTAVNENILIENIEVFRKNGFEFDISMDAEPTKRVRLSAKPTSRNWEFGKEDIDELLFMLQDSPHTMCRPSRVRAMFASRACRKSVMIGTALNKATMHQLVEHMGEIEQPWNCPHGRPTMRHLVNLELVRKR